MHTVMFALGLFLSAPALAEAPAPESRDISTWDSSEYNNFLVDQGLSAVQQIIAKATLVEGVNVAEVHQFRAESIDILRERRGQVASVPAYRKNTAFRDAILQSFDQAIEVYEDDLKELYDLFYLVAPRTADLKRADALTLALRQRSAAMDTDLDEAQEEFSRAHRLVLVEPDVPEWPDPEQFSADGIPPDGLHLGANTFMRLTVNYANVHYRTFNPVVDTLNRCFEVQPEYDPEGAVAASEELKLVVSHARRRMDAIDESWLGSPHIHDAAETYVGAGEAIIPWMEEYALLWSKKRLKGKDERRINELVGLMNREINAARTAFARSETRWNLAWHLEEYNEFLARQAK